MSVVEAATAEPHPSLEPPLGRWLPLTAADVGDARERYTTEHAWPGSLFVFLARLLSLGMGAGAVVAVVGTVIGFIMGDWGPALLAAAAAVALGTGCVVQHSLGSHVSRFTRWGWYGAMGELAVAALAQVNVMATTGDVGGPLFGLVIDVLWMRYFWNRRADFDIDLGI